MGDALAVARSALRSEQGVVDVNALNPQPPSPLVPSTAEDWEPWRILLTTLYLRENRTLKEIMTFMEQSGYLKAT